MRDCASTEAIGRSTLRRRQQYLGEMYAVMDLRIIGCSAFGGYWPESISIQASAAAVMAERMHTLLSELGRRQDQWNVNRMNRT